MPKLIMDQVDPTLIQNASLGISKYAPGCLIFFAITGMVLQIPVVYVHSGLFSRPNVPVIMMSVYYFYSALAATLNAFAFSSDNKEQWWSGYGWCDFNVRMFLAVSLGVLSTQCVINKNLLQMLHDRPRMFRGREAVVQSLIELALCTFMPIVSLCISTFYMNSRFNVIQDVGCIPNLDTSAASVVTYYMWLPILGAVALVTMILIAIRFYRRGKAAAMETVSFIPHMSPSQFLRIIIFSLVVTGIFVPLTIAVAVINFVGIDKVGISKLAWVHGKPETWNTIIYITFSEAALYLPSSTKNTMIVFFIILYINIVISWMLFICYGTGTMAIEAYKKTFRVLFKPPRDRKLADDWESFASNSPTSKEPNSAIKVSFEA